MIKIKCAYDKSKMKWYQTWLNHPQVNFNNDLTMKEIELYILKIEFINLFFSLLLISLNQSINQSINQSNKFYIIEFIR